MFKRSLFFLAAFALSISGQAQTATFTRSSTIEMTLAGGAITCSTEHQKRLTRMRKIERDHRLCSHCGRPSSPDERGQFRAWRTSKALDPHKKNSKAAKGIRGPATGNHNMEDFAYVVLE